MAPLYIEYQVFKLSNCHKFYWTHLYCSGDFTVGVFSFPKTFKWILPSDDSYSCRQQKGPSQWCRLIMCFSILTLLPLLSQNGHKNSSTPYRSFLYGILVANCEVMDSTSESFGGSRERSTVSCGSSNSLVIGPNWDSPDGSLTRPRMQ